MRPTGLRRCRPTSRQWRFVALLEVECGNDTEVSKWFDFRRFVKGHTVTPPAAYASLDEFNRALESVVLGHDRLEMPPEDHPTWHHPKLRIGPDINNAEGGPVKELGRR
jgi:hypothetical protein